MTRTVLIEFRSLADQAKRFLGQLLGNRRRVPISGMLGLGASAVAVVLWTVEQLTVEMLFEFLTIPDKMLVVVAPFLFLSDLSKFLHKRPRVAIGLGLTLVAVTLSAMLACLPSRQAFAERFSNSVYRCFL